MKKHKENLIKMFLPIVGGCPSRLDCFRPIALAQLFPKLVMISLYLTLRDPSAHNLDGECNFPAAQLVATPRGFFCSSCWVMAPPDKSLLSRCCPQIFVNRVISPGDKWRLEKVTQSSVIRTVLHLQEHLLRLQTHQGPAIRLKGLET